MTKRMLVDATHDEETRVAVMDGDRLEEFDYESKARKPLKGSIFLAKVTRVEPSLQAAFVNFGGNRHGFLPFSEIHPDYFRIPIADREALMAEQQAELEARAREEEEMDAEEEAAARKKDRNKKDDDVEDATDDDADDVDGDDAQEEDSSEPDEGNEKDEESDSQDDEESSDKDADDDGQKDESDQKERGGRGRGRRGQRGGRGRRSHRSKRSERYDNEDEETRFRFNLRRKYKIQEVIKRGQIMLVQVSKEERGNKGAAVSSYLSLPGRYCVLMPNSPRAGGVSRKIANYKDRARMRELMRELEIPQGMSVILRTAGVSRTKTEVKRDLDYLMRLWNNIREATLESSAPSMIYEEANLIKRAVRDLYTRDVEDIIVSGAEGYKTAKDFMKMMIPSHAKRVQEYKDDGMPLFNRYKAEAQIAEIGETEVTLPSGGYLIINPTEALVSVDVNSGKATKERHIEETALKTNLEAASEVARQLRLRDLGGLVVVDFIDMEDRRNNGKVERRMRDALSTDRARIQMGRISMFGLMELSRQRMNPSLTESQFETCTRCNGMGRVRSCDATSIMVLRAIEDEGIKNRAAQVIVHVSNEVALYILNKKRKTLIEIEGRYGFEVLLRVDESMGAAGFRVEVSKPSRKDSDDDDFDGDDDYNRGESNDDDDQKSSRNRRGRRGGRGRGGRGRGRGGDNRQNEQDSDGNTNDQSLNDAPEADGNKKSEDQDEKSSSSRGRKPSAKDKPDEQGEGDVKEEKPKRTRRSSKTKDESKTEEKGEDKAEKKSKPKKAAAKKSDAKDNEAEEEKPKTAKKSSSSKKKAAPSNDDAPKEDPDYVVVNEAPEKKKKGWWSRGSD